MSSRSDIARHIASVARKPYDDGVKSDPLRPYLRGGAAVNKAAAELLKLFGRKAGQICSVCRIQQAFFLIDRGWYGKRDDLMLTGRTLAGAPPPKEKHMRLEDQCGGSINERVMHYVNDVIAERTKKKFVPLDENDVIAEEIWIDDFCRNGTAPNQYEFFEERERSDIAIYYNTLLTDIMKKTALRHNLICLPHEKPFAGIGGSGKSVVWSLSDGDDNLLDPGGTAEKNLIFLTFLVSVIHAIHRHGGLLRAAAASAGGEERLSGSDAPPAVISVSLGEQLAKIIAAIESGKAEKGKRRGLADLGLCPLPKLARGAADSGRASPVAFTGDGFEFRMIGGSTDVSTAVTVINTIAADSMKIICERIKKELGKVKGGVVNADNGSDKQGDGDSRWQELSAAVLNALSAVIKESKPILFDGDNRSKEWAKEAQARGLPNSASTLEALKAFIAPEAVELFEHHKIFSESELKALYSARLDEYEKTLDAEVKTLTDIVNTQVLPAAYNYQTDIASGLEVLRVLADDMTIEMTEGALEDRKEMFEKLTADIYYVRKNLKELAAMADKARGMETAERAAYLFKEVKPQMRLIRRYVDALEEVMPDDLWPLPKYKEMLFIL